MGAGDPVAAMNDQGPLLVLGQRALALRIGVAVRDELVAPSRESVEPPGSGRTALC